MTSAELFECLLYNAHKHGFTRVDCSTLGPGQLGLCVSGASALDGLLLEEELRDALPLTIGVFVVVY